jgi:hypothetical protein
MRTLPFSFSNYPRLLIAWFGVRYLSLCLLGIRAKIRGFCTHSLRRQGCLNVAWGTSTPHAVGVSRYFF